MCAYVSISKFIGFRQHGLRRGLKHATFRQSLSVVIRVGRSTFLLSSVDEATGPVIRKNDLSAASMASTHDVEAMEDAIMHDVTTTLDLLIDTVAPDKAELEAASNFFLFELHQLAGTDEYSTLYRTAWIDGPQSEKIEDPAAVVKLLPELAKRVNEENSCVFLRLLYRIFQCHEMLCDLSASMPEIARWCPDTLWPEMWSIFELLIENDVQSIANLALFYQSIDSEEIRAMIRKKAVELIHVSNQRTWRVRNEVIFQLHGFLGMMKDPEQIFIYMYEIGSFALVETNATNRSALDHLLAETLAVLVKVDTKYAEKFADDLNLRFAKSVKSRHRMSFASICAHLLIDQKISDENFDCLLGDAFFLYMPHDKAATVRGKFVQALTRKVRIVFDVSRRAPIIRHILLQMNAIDESVTVRKSAGEVLCLFYMKETSTGYESFEEYLKIRKIDNDSSLTMTPSTTISSCSYNSSSSTTISWIFTDEDMDWDSSDSSESNISEKQGMDSPYEDEHWVQLSPKQKEDGEDFLSEDESEC